MAVPPAKDLDAALASIGVFAIEVRDESLEDLLMPDGGTTSYSADPTTLFCGLSTFTGLG